MDVKPFPRDTTAAEAVGLLLTLPLGVLAYAVGVVVDAVVAAYRVARHGVVEAQVMYSTEQYNLHAAHSEAAARYETSVRLSLKAAEAGKGGAS